MIYIAENLDSWRFNMKVHRYFIAYTSTECKGNVVLDLEKEIDSWKDIIEIEERLSKDFNMKTIIDNFKLLKTED